MDLKTIPQKLVGNENERAVSPVIGVILMVAITVILAAVIAAFVLDIGPGDADPNAAVEVDANGESADIELISLDSGSTDGVAIVAEEEVEDGDGSNGDIFFDEGDIIANLTTSGEQATVEWGNNSDNEEWEPEDDSDDVEFTVRSYAGDLKLGDNMDDATAQAIEDEFTLEDPDAE